MSNPVASVVVPNYNYGRYLDERIGSLLAQTFTDLEIVFVDDASTDESRAVIERYRDQRLRATWFPTRSRSTYQRWNDGAAQARGRYLCFAGADDSCEPDFLSELVGALESCPDAGLAYCRSRVIGPDGEPRGLTPSNERWSRDFVTHAAAELPYLLDQKTIPTASAVVVRREAFERCGGFDTTFRLAADHMLWVRILKDWSFAFRSRPLNRFRTHDGTVRAAAPRSVTVEERYRVYGHVLQTFAIDSDARERLRDRLARNWIDCWSADKGPGRVERHRAIYRAARPVDPSIASRVGRLWTERTLGVRVRGPRTVLRYAWRRMNDERYLFEGRRILWKYSAHYRQARRAYRQLHPRAPAPVLSIRDVGVQVVRPDDRGAALRLPQTHDAVVRRVAAAVDRELAVAANCRFVPALSTARDVARTEDLPEVANEQLISIQLRDPLAVDGLHELCEPLMEEIERAIYGTFVIVDKVYAYRNPISRAQPGASWLWHFDNHPREVLKVIVYLTDVAEGTGPFEYLRRADGRPVYGTPLAPLHRRSRVEGETVDDYLAGGHHVEQVTGPRGTVIVFDDNVVHRATLAATGVRDVIVFQIRPSLFRPSPHVNAEWTGSFLHENVNRDPYDLMPHWKAGRA